MSFRESLFILVVLFTATSNNVFCGTADTTGGCSVKSRWTVKASLSGYKCWDRDNLVLFGDFERMNNKKYTNFRLEANFGLSKYLEIGLFAGFQDYLYLKTITEIDSETSLVREQKTIAPTFGIMLNFHLLPIFVKGKYCRWDFYLTTKYGGCYLPHLELDKLDDLDTHYRHEYGIGLGLAYYIRNRAGFFAEFMFGKFSLFPEVQSSSNFRAGITCKI